ncbi:hypothetical protein KA005_42945, partial [bacterium]|nr:hypothetical protein [bacterium]
SDVIAQEKGEWIKILPEAERMQRIAIYATPEIRQRIPLRVKLPGIITRDEVEKKITYKRLVAPGAGLTIEVGKPELPALRRFVKIPLGAKASLEGITSQSKIIRGYEVYPAQEP